MKFLPVDEAFILELFIRYNFAPGAANRTFFDSPCIYMQETKTKYTLFLCTHTIYNLQNTIKDKLKRTNPFSAKASTNQS